MSVIAAVKASGTSSVASLLSDAASAASVAGSPASSAPKSDQAGSSASTISPATLVTLSDRAKAVLERNKVDQIVAERLAQQVASSKKGSGKAEAASSNAATGDASKLFEALAGSNASQAAGATSGNFRDLSAELTAMVTAHKQADGSVTSFTKTESDVFVVPSTPEQIDYWYQMDGRGLIAGAQFFREEAATGIAQAVQNREITIQSAKDIPGLNFHNTMIFEGGEGGASLNGTSSYNKDADIFKDPTMNYRVYGNGTVISWKKPEGDATLGVVPATGPIFWETPVRPN
jgi:hypothetical protein